MSETVRLIDVNISDVEVAALARISKGIAWDEAKDLDNKTLVKKLWVWGHHSPFEFQQFIFFIKAPIFIARQWFRHRTGTFLEKSLRYTMVEDDAWVYIPDMNPELMYIMGKSYERSFEVYEALLDQGVAKEDARAVLPLGLYTQFYWRVDARNLYNFLKLRLDKHAQKEIQDYAREILDILEAHEATENIAKLWKQELLGEEG